MSYIGNQSQTAYSSLVKQDITGNGGSTYTLSHPVSSENDILLYINNVKQEGGVGKAFTATGTTLTLSENISSSDSCYVQYIGLAIQTVVPTDGSVTSAKLDTNIAVSGNLNVSGAFTSQGIDDNANATAITIDSSESVGIGISNPSSYDDGADKLVVGKTDDRSGITVVSSTSTAGSIHFADGTGTSSYRGIIGYYHDNDSMRFYTGGASEKMRIDSSGSLLINNTGASPLDSGRVRIYNNTAQDALKTYQATAGTTCLWNRIDSTSSYFAVFRYQASTVGTITTNGSSTSYNTSSDYRLKESVSYDFDATTRLKQLKPCRFNFIADADRTVDGFLAHEVQSVVPEAITGTHNEVDDDGNPVYQQIDQAKLVPLLVKTIQELEARITALENA